MLVRSVLALTCLLATICLPAVADDQADEQAQAVRAIVLYFPGPEGLDLRLADSLRLKLRRQEGWDVVDRITTQELIGVMTDSALPRSVAPGLMEWSGSQIAIYGDIAVDGDATTVTLSVINSLDGDGSLIPDTHTYTDNTERWRAVIVRQIVEDLTGQTLWSPPEQGIVAEPDTFGDPLNSAGDFDHAEQGWTPADDVAIFYEAGEEDRGAVLRIRTDLERQPYLDYLQRLRLGQLDAGDPPQIARDTSYGSLAGIEGVHVRSHWIPATPGQQYWLVADVKCQANQTFFPRIFVKGFLDAPELADGLHETSLREMQMTPADFAELPEARRRELIAQDAGDHPERYRRQCYETYLACRNDSGEWRHFAMPIPPRGGLPDNVQWLRIDIFCYWPPGEYLIDNVFLYADPGQTAPLPEEPPRTPNVRSAPAE